MLRLHITEIKCRSCPHSSLSHLSPDESDASHIVKVGGGGEGAVKYSSQRKKTNKRVKS